MTIIENQGRGISAKQIIIENCSQPSKLSLPVRSIRHVSGFVRAIQTELHGTKITQSKIDGTVGGVFQQVRVSLPTQVSPNKLLSSKTGLSVRRQSHLWIDSRRRDRYSLVDEDSCSPKFHSREVLARTLRIVVYLARSHETECV